MIIVINQVENAEPSPFLNANLGLIDVFCDSFKKIIFNLVVSASLMVNIQESVCSFIDTTFSRYQCQIFSQMYLFSYFLLRSGRSFDCLDFRGAEIYVAVKGAFWKLQNV